MQTKEKKIIATKLRAGHTLQRSLKNKTFFSLKCSLFVAYILQPPFSRQVSTCLMLYWCPAIGKKQQQKYYDEFSFSLNLEKNVAKIQTKQKLFIKKTWGLLLTTWTINFFVWLKKTRKKEWKKINLK